MTASQGLWAGFCVHSTGIFCCFVFGPFFEDTPRPRGQTPGEAGAHVNE